MFPSFARLAPFALILATLPLFAAGPDSNQPRYWTDSSGKHRLKATLQEVTEDAVKLEKPDGDVITVPLDKLSETDRRWLARQKDAGAGGTIAAATGEWPCFNGPRHDNRSPDTGLLKQWPAGGPRQLWKVDFLGQGYSAITVSGGTVYASGQHHDHLFLYALDSSGKLKWKQDVGPGWTKDYPGARSSPTIDGGNIYLLSGPGQIGCYSAQDGRRRWSRDAREFGGACGHWGYAESVLVLGKLAIFKPGGKNCIMALDKATGRDVWASRGFAAEPEYSSCIPVALGKTEMVVTGTKGGIVGVNARTGQMLWANAFSAGNTANCPTPVAGDGYIFWANGYGKGGIALELGAGGVREAWTTHDMVCHHGGYVIDHGFVYGNNEGKWSCLELKSGKTVWQDRGVGKGSLTWADGMLYLFAEQGGQAALASCAAQGLEIRGRVKVDGEGTSWAHPVVIGGRLYLRYDTNLYCFDVRGQ